MDWKGDEARDKGGVTAQEYMMMKSVLNGKNNSKTPFKDRHVFKAMGSCSCLFWITDEIRCRTD